MKSRQLATAILVVTILALSAGGSAAQDAGPGTGGHPASTLSIEATVNSRISYQGVLKESGVPVTGSRDLTFRLYSDDACTTQVGSDIAKPGVQVTEGLFSAALDVAHSDFDGQALWIEVEVSGTAIGCREILPVPYALALRPGATMSGNEGIGVSSTGTGDHTSAVYGLAQGGSGIIYGVRGNSNSPTGRGVAGYATSSSGNNAGVLGETPSTGGRGVFGNATATSGHTSGVYGAAVSMYGRGVFGRASAITGTTYGVYGQSDADGGRGVYGEALATSGSAYGVYGLSQSGGGRGVFGHATAVTGTTSGVYGWAESDSGRGVFGNATAATGTTYGVYGKSASDDGWGVYGQATADSGSTVGVRGRSESPLGYGVYGEASAGSGPAIGVYGLTSSHAGRGVRGLATAITGTTVGVIGEVGSDAGTAVLGLSTAITGTTYGVYGESASPDGFGLFGANSAGGYAGYFKGDVAQDRAADGLVKAAVYADCGNPSTIHRSFNTIGSSTTITNTSSVGHCTIDLDFQISDRFWVTNAINKSAPRFVMCYEGAIADTIECECYDHSGVAQDTTIMVLIY